jgi:hypothetical protein
LRLLPDGRVFSDRSLQKIRAAERGWRAAAAELEAQGAAPLDEGADGDARREWLARILPVVTRAFRHGGNHRYAWALDRPTAQSLAPSGSYPKRGLEVAA